MAVWYFWKYFSVIFLWMIIRLVLMNDFLNSWLENILTRFSILMSSPDRPLIMPPLA